MGRRITVGGIESRLRARRLAAGLSQQALAERAGLTRQAVSGIEGGQYVPNTAVALRLAAALGCSVEDLFTLEPALPRVEAELLAEAPATGKASGEPLRVQVARVGERLLARPLVGPDGPMTAADGLVVGPAGSPRRTAAARSGLAVNVDLMVDPRLVENTVVVLGCDPALGLLAAHLTRRYPGLRLAWGQSGSLTALRRLGRGEAHAAGTHLWDPDTGEYNLPYIRQELAGRHVLVVTLSQWQQGLIVGRGNPKGIDGPADLARPDLAIVNREPGSGSRTLLDARLEAASVASSSVRGYGREVPSHMAVAEAVARGVADAGPGILAAAQAFGLDFIPQQEERYDLVIPREHLDTPPVQALLEIATGPVYRSEVEALGGYDFSRAGTVVAELPQ